VRNFAENALKYFVNVSNVVTCKIKHKHLQNVFFFVLHVVHIAAALVRLYFSALWTSIATLLIKFYWSDLFYHWH